METNMKIKCINDCCGDFWNITVGKKYKVLEYIKDYLLYINNGVQVTEERYRVIDNEGDEYCFPISCFEAVGE